MRVGFKDATSPEFLLLKNLLTFEENKRQPSDDNFWFFCALIRELVRGSAQKNGNTLRKLNYKNKYGMEATFLKIFSKPKLGHFFNIGFTSRLHSTDFS